MLGGSLKSILYMSVFQDRIIIGWGWTAGFTVRLLTTVIPEADKYVKGGREAVVHFPLDGSGCFWYQSGNLPSYRIDNSLYTFPRVLIGIVHFFVASKVDR